MGGLLILTGNRRAAVLGLAAACIAATLACQTPAGADVAGAVQIDGSEAATASANVTITVPAPTNSSGTLRLSDDGGATWVVRDWTTSLRWSLIDPAAGGVDADGAKTVEVQGGDGSGPWTPLGSASILLDRTGPVVSPPTLNYGNRVVDFLRLPATDAGVGLARTEVSLDDTHWRSLDPSPFSFYGPNTVDVREGTIGGTWTPGTRTIYTRAIDKLGNITDGAPLTEDVTDMYLGVEPHATFEYPLAAVVNQPFTIAPVFDSGFTVPPGDYCQWTLDWGDQGVRLEAQSDETYGEVRTSVPAKNGVCAPWTFTLPYTPPREYTWRLMINSAPDLGDYATSALGGSFRAAPGGTSRAVSQSNLPLVYILPDRSDVGLGDVVTYRLYAVGGASTDGGYWRCNPSDGSPSNVYTIQNGGTVFQCRVSTSEPYSAGWIRDQGIMEWRAAYDPIADLNKPAMGHVVVAPTAGSAVTTSGTSTRVSWSAHDIGTGLARYTLQQSINGHTWQSVALPSRLATTLTRSVAYTSTYRYRVQATDRAGNTSAWAYSALFRPNAYDDSTSSPKWSTGWGAVAMTGALHGYVHRAKALGNSVRFRFTGRAASIAAARGTIYGYAQVVVDGTLVATLNLHSTANAAPRVVWSRYWSSSGGHTVVVRNLGTRGHPYLAIDSFAILH